MKMIGQNFFAGLVLAALGVVGPIAWDYYKSKSQIQIQLVDSSPIIEKSNKLDGLQILYNGENIERLYRATFLVQNTGRTPILKKDVIHPLFIQLAGDAKPIEAKLIGTSPKNVDASVNLDKVDSRVLIDFSLLNSEDLLKISVLVQLKQVGFEAGARIAGVTDIVIVQSPKIEKISSKKNIWLVVTIGFFSSLLALVGVVGFFHAIAELKMKRLFRKNRFYLPDFKTRNDLKGYVDSKFFFVTSDEKSEFLAKIDSLDDCENFSSVYGDKIIEELRHMLEHSLKNAPMTLIVLVPSLAGFLYIFG